MAASAVDRQGAPTPRGPIAARQASRVRAGWIPRQHGAWAMLVVPYLIGVAIAIDRGRAGPADAAIFALWVAGYFAFFATSTWLKSRRKRSYLPPVRAYGLLVVALGVLTLILQPTLWSWLLPYTPILIIGLSLAYRRDDRSVLSGLSTVAAACLMPAVVVADGLFDLIGGLGTGRYAAVGLVALICFGYFFGTVLYVKTLIRQRGHVGYLVASVAWHIVCAVAVLPLAVAGSPVASWSGWALLAFFTVMAGRALAVPLCWPMRGRRLGPGRIGIGELLATGALMAILIVSVG